MFGNDDGGHRDHGGFSIGQLLFALFMWRELESGRVDAGIVFKALFVIAAVLGGGFLLLLLVIGASTPRYDSSLYLETPYVWPTEAPAYVAPAWTPAAAWTPKPAPTASPTPRPTPVPGIGKKVPAGGGWFVTVTKVQRWRPSWYHQPGWRLVTVYVTVRMPAEDGTCVWGDNARLTARGDNEYQGWIESTREPSLYACSDYHRAGTAKGWLTFEVRDKDAKGLVMSICPDVLGLCEQPAMIRIS